MKSFKFMALCLCAVIAGMCIISCDKDDDETNNSIVGTWDATSINDDCYFMFCDDGIGYDFLLENGTEISEVEKFKYSHNKSTGALKVTYDDNTEITYDWNAKVTGNTMAISFYGISGVDLTEKLKKVTIKATRDDLEYIYQKENED